MRMAWNGHKPKVATAGIEIATTATDKKYLYNVEILDAILG